MKKHLIILFLVSALSIQAQNQLEFFGPLTGGIWKAEGAWGNGTKFRQEKTFEFQLNNQIIVSKSKGYTNQEQTTYGPRNHGVYAYDKESDTINFWEFDVFGGVTQGTITSNGKDIIYSYEYGDYQLTDYWEFVDDRTYNFKVGTFKDGVWEQVFQSTQFKRSNE